jgi:hypothetical protein
MTKPSTVQVSLKLPFVEIAGTWAPDEAERNVAWGMYVELITRVSVVELAPDEGSLREALNALYSLFPRTREILHRYGPAVAQPSRGSELSFGAIAIAVLNQGLRPLLTKWHPELAAYEATRSPGVSPTEHERAWPANQELRAQLDALRERLSEYANALSQARVPELTPMP